MAFTDYETEQLRKALLKETRHCAVTLGMKKTSVEQLTKAVGIAKGSFYKFYESKEMLFFAVLENIHSELYGVADHALSEADSLPPPERTAKAVLAVCRRMSKMCITTTTRRTFVCFWKNMALFLNGGFHLPPRQYAD